MTYPSPGPFHTIFGETHSLIIPTPDTSLLIPPPSPSSINTTFLYPPLSPSTSDTGSTSCSSSCTSPHISDNEELVDVPMEQLFNVKKLLRMFPPPMTAGEFIRKNSFQASDGHIKRPSNNFILFRKIAHDQKNQTPALSNYNERQFSQIIGRIWKGLTQEEILTYKTLGKEVAEMHKKQFPKYKYQPKRDKAAWKHFNPESNNSNQKPKRKNNKVKQQKEQETISDIPKINVNNIFQQQQQQQQQQIIQESIDYPIPSISELEQMDSMYYPPYTTNNTYPTNNTYTANSSIIDYFNVNDGCNTYNTNNEDYSNTMNSMWKFI